MSAQLSKLHVRFIQSQTNLYLCKEGETNSFKLPLSQLYVKDNDHFYLINQDAPFAQDQHLALTFKEPTPALNTLSCKVSLQEIKEESEAYDDTLLFFNAQPHEVNQLLLLTIEEIK